jgi:hypothetical protein
MVNVVIKLAFQDPKPALVCDEILPDGRIRRSVVDPGTGEIYTRGIHGYRATKKKPDEVFQPPFARVWMSNLLKLVKNKELKQGERALLFDLLAFLDWQSTMLVHPEKGHAVTSRDIASYLDLSVGFVSETLNSLHDKGVIGKYSAGKGRPHKYHFNCNIAFYGKNMNDMRDYERFNSDCAFSPFVRVEYKGEVKPSRTVRKDLCFGKYPMDKNEE